MENLYKNHFHLEPPRGLLNDPNGLSYFQGNYYVFHQWNRFDLNHNYKEWGLFISSDLLRWKHQGSALLPDSEKDLSGVYSGSALVVDDELCLFYTGNSKKDGKRRSLQCLATSNDGQTFQKMEEAVKTPSLYTEHHRDPKVWCDKDGYQMLVGGQTREGVGAIAYYQSSDCRDWEHKGLFFSSDALDQMAECPDYFELDGQSVLLVCPQKRDLLRDEDISSYSAYYIGSVKDKIFHPQTNIQSMDAGFDFYAPQTFLDPKGRRLMWAWMSRMSSQEEEQCPTREFGYLHCLTMPRELKMIEDKLYQLPLEEMLQKRKVLAHRKDKNHMFQEAEAPSVLDIAWTEVPSTFEISLFQQHVNLVYEGKDLILSRQSWMAQKIDTKTIRIEEIKTLQIFIDCSAMEIFINQGERVLSLRYFLHQENRTCQFHSSHQMELTYSKIES